MDWQRRLLGYHGKLIGRSSLHWDVLFGFRLGHGCWVGITMIGSGLLILCCCCALRLEGKSQVGIIPICISSEGS